MCGRFLTPEERAFERHWGLRHPAYLSQSYNLAPSRLAPIVRINKDDGQRVVEGFTWNFRPRWAKRPYINARAETAWTNKMFASASIKRRCLVPAIGWYEWQGERPPKQPYVMHLGDFRPFSFAGIWTAMETAGGWHRTFAILTRPAEPSIASIHDRMPAVLHSSRYDAWLSPETSGDDAREIAMEQIHGIEAYAVSSYVNKPDNDSEECIAPLR